MRVRLWKAVVPAATALAAALVSLAALRAPIAAGAPGRTAEPPFLLETTRGGAYRFTLRSAATGRVLVDYGTLGRRRDFTNNGLSPTPDRSALYLTLIGRRSLKIERMDAATHRLSFVADGENPAVSPNGRLLAYVVGTEALAVRNLRTGATTRLSLAHLVPGHPLMDGELVWTRGASNLVVLAGEPLTLTTAGGRRNGPRATPAGTGCDRRHACLLDVAVTPGDRVHLSVGSAPRAVDWMPVGQPTASEGWSSALFTVDAGHGYAVQRVSVAHGQLRVSTAATVRAPFVFAVSPGSDAVLYFDHQGGPRLWEAQLSRSRLSHAHPLAAGQPIGALVW